MPSTWSIAELLAYRRTRFPLRRFGPLALFLTLAAAALDETPTIRRVGLSILLVLPWLLQFRLGDDLADRERDCRDHPDRVLVRADARPFIVVLLLLTVGNTLLTAWLLPGPRWLEFLTLNGLFLIWYTTVRGLPPFPAGLGVLLKYPAFVFLLRPTGSVGDGRAVCVLVLIYTCFVAYEILHDKRSWTVPGIAGALALALAAMATAALLPGWPWSASWVVPGCFVLAWLFWRHQQRRDLAGWAGTVFLVTFAWLAGTFFVHPHLGSTYGAGW